MHVHCPVCSKTIRISANNVYLLRPCSMDVWSPCSSCHLSKRSFLCFIVDLQCIFTRRCHLPPLFLSLHIIPSWLAIIPPQDGFGRQLQLLKVLVLKLVHFHVHMQFSHLKIMDQGSSSLHVNLVAFLVSSYEQKVPIACFKLKFIWILFLFDA